MYRFNAGGKKGTVFENRVRPVVRPFIFDVRLHRDLGCMWDDRDSCGVSEVMNYSLYTTRFVHVRRRGFYVVVSTGFVLYCDGGEWRTGTQYPEIGSDVGIYIGVRSSRW